MRQLDGDREFAEALAYRVARVALDAKFKCVVPGDQPHRAWFWRDDRGLWVFRHRARTPAPQSYSLAQLFASVCAGKAVRPDGPELGVWKVRALVELGFVDVPAIVIPRHTGCSSAEEWFLRGVELLFGVRQLVGQDERTPLVRRFLADWTGLPERFVDRAKARLIEEGTVAQAGLFGATTLWRLAARSDA